MHTFARLYNSKSFDCPYWINDNLIYTTLMGSHAYGVNKEESDIDLYGIVIPPKNMVFFVEDIVGFGKLKTLENRFKNFQKHHIIDKDDKNNREYDVNIYNIVDFFQLAKECNPNILETLFTPINCISHSTSLGKTLRDNRELFLSKKVYFTMTNYAFSQISKSKSIERTGKRKDVVDRLGYDPKMLYHTARLIDQCEQLLLFGTMELGRNKEYLKAIRREEVGYDEVVAKFNESEIYLKKLYEDSKTIPHKPDEEKIKELLFNCLEHHYGSIDSCVVRPDSLKNALLKIEDILNGIRKEIH